MNRCIPALLLCAACSQTPPVGPEKPQDTTPPAVLSRYPTSGDANALASGPYRVVFTEPLDPASVTAEAVHVTQAGNAIAAALTLSADGTTLDIAPKSAPAIPGHVEVTLTAALKDLAGNAFVPETTAWAFDLPVWVEPGGPAFISHSDGANPGAWLVLDANDEPVVGMANVSPDYVMHFANGAWSALPAPPSFSIHATIAGDGLGGLWQADVTGGVNVFTGTAWSRVGEVEPPVDPAAYRWDTRLVLRNGKPVLSWIEYVPGVSLGDPSYTMHVRGWNGTSWETWADDPGPVVWPSIASGPGGVIVASWNENSDARVARIGPGGIERIAALPNTSGVHGVTAVAANAQGNPVVVYGEDAGTAMAIRAKAWTGSAWLQVGEDLSPYTQFGATTPAIAIGADGLPVVAWTEGGYDLPRRLYVARFDGSQWHQLGGPLNAVPDHDVWDVALALDRRGAPVLAWAEATGEKRTDNKGNVYAVYQFLVKRLNR